MDAPVWDQDGRDWPNRAASRFVEAGGIRWHVQVAGDGPAILLVHGTGGATHSWAGLLPLLARHATIIAPDLPGHGFTAMPPPRGMSLPGMAAGVTALLDALGARPVLAVGHSAGAAVVVRMALDGAIAPATIVSLNGALLPLRGPAGDWFSPIARTLVMIPAVPKLFAWRGRDRGMVDRLLAGTGSTVGPEIAEFYARLVRRSGHVGAALTMMAQWSLDPLAADLPRLRVPLLLAVGDNDRTILPGDAHRVRALLPPAEIVTFPGLGHLMHEETPAPFAALIAGRLPTP